MIEIDHNKRLGDVLSHAKCPRCNCNDKEAVASVGDNYNLRCKHCWYEWTESLVNAIHYFGNIWRL
jgi:hypothetical protein